MTRRQELAARRAQAKRALSLSKRKYNRITGELGVDNLGKYQPRLPDPATIDRYTMKQLDSFIASSEQFRSRTHDQQFVKLGRDQVITRQRWNQFERIQKERTRQARDAFASIENLFIDSLGQTIGERKQEITPRRRRQLEGSYAHSPEPKTAGQIPSEQALDQLETKLEGYNDGSEQARIRDSAMQALNKMDDVFSAHGDPEFVAQLNDLTDDQFYALWMIRDFAQSAADWYVNAQRLDTNAVSSDKAAQIEHRISQSKAELQGLIDSVKKIQGTGRRF